MDDQDTVTLEESVTSDKVQILSHQSESLLFHVTRQYSMTTILQQSEQEGFILSKPNSDWKVQNLYHPDQARVIDGTQFVDETEFVKLT